MNILIVNANSNIALTAQLKAVAENLVHSATFVDAVCPSSEPLSIQGNYDALRGGAAVAELIFKHRQSYDAFIIACYSDPALFAARELTTSPVYGIAQASMLSAAYFGHRFSILSPLARLKPVLENLVRLYGLESLCASVRTVEMDVMQAFENIDQANQAFAEAGRLAVTQDGAEVLCLGGAIFAGRDHMLRDLIGVPCLDGLSCALKTAEAHFDLGYTTSKAGLFLPPEIG